MSRRCLDGTAAGARSQQMSSSSRRVRRSHGDSSSDDDDDDAQDAPVSSSRPVTCPSPSAAKTGVTGLRRPNNCNASRGMHFSAPDF